MEYKDKFDCLEFWKSFKKNLDEVKNINNIFQNYKIYYNKLRYIFNKYINNIDEDKKVI